MKYQCLIYAPADADGVAVVTLNRPEHQNLLDVQMRAELRHAMHLAGGRARAVVLTGAGKAFCAAEQLGAPDPDKAGSGGGPEQVLRDEFMPLARAIIDCPVPVIAAVNGAAAGMGAALALLADLVVASRAASFVFPQTRLGLIPDGGVSWLLPRLVGPARAAGLLLLGERISARRAAEWGLIWEAVSEADFEFCWRGRARQLAAGPNLAFTHLRASLRESWRQDLPTQMAAEATAQGACGRSRDFREGLIANHEDRPPRFEGR